MKRTNNLLVAALAGIVLAVFAGSAQAQYKATGDDGITASPKARQLLDEQNRNQAILAAPASIPQMACPKCKDKVTERVDSTARGANKPTIRVVTHLCEGCGTDWNTTGVGKAKQSVASHKCDGCGAENLACCNTAKGGNVATTGMDKKHESLNRTFEVAPLKSLK